MKILQFIGVLNVSFIALNGSYQITSEYFSHITMITVLVILVIISFVKDILSFIGVKILYKPLDYLFRFVTIVITGVLSSFVILIPKLILLESQQLDSTHLKFTARVIRNWSNEELAIYLSSLVDSRGVSHLISESDQAHIIETVTSMRELRNSLNNLVNERLLALNSKVVEPANMITPIVTESSWLSEHVLLVTVASVLAVITVAGIGYLVYKNYSPGSEVDKTSTSSSSSGEEDYGSIIFPKDFIEGLDSEVVVKEVTYDETALAKNLEEATNYTGSVHAELGDRIDGIEDKVWDIKDTVSDFKDTVNDIENKVWDIEDTVNGIKGVNDGIDEQLTVLGDNIESTEQKLIAELRKSEASHVSFVSERIKWLEEKIAGVRRTTKMADSSLSKRVSELENIKEGEAKSVTYFVETLVDGIRSEILNTDEVAAVRALLSNETIREMLCSEEVKRITESIKKKG